MTIPSPKKRIGHFERENLILVSLLIVVPVGGLIASIAFVHMKDAIESGRQKKAAAAVQSAGVSAEPRISLFDSTERVKAFLKNEAKLDYSDKFLSGVRLMNVESVPKKGTAWVYSFSFKKPRLGGDIVIYHYMEGEIIEFTFGP